MLDHLLAWLGLAVRWIHLIVGIAWIGTSFYFNWLNSRIAPPATPLDGVKGELWSVHGGAFYRSLKYEVAPGELPAVLHWFKWEAYATWLSGLVLLTLVYYLQADAYLVGSGDSALSGAAAIGIGIAALIGSWVVYDLLCRSPLGRRPAELGVLVFALALALTWGLSRSLSGRAAYIHVGAALGTIMAANVLMVIIPSQRRMVQAMERGTEPDASKGVQAALRSLHNNYLTLPVLFIMISNHAPFTYGGTGSWVVLGALAVVGVVTRHAFNLRNQGRPNPWLLPAAAVGLVVLAYVTVPTRSGDGAVGAGAERVAYPVVAAIIGERCVPCHAAEPTFTGYDDAPGGIELDTPDRVRAFAARIKEITVETQFMPLGNLTGMTEEERAVVGRWIREGAALP